MADFKTQVEDLIGSVGDDALITQSLIDIGGEIIGSLPNTKLLSSALAVAVSSSGLSISDKRILAVDKDDLPVRKIQADRKARHNDTASIYAATDTNPVYYVEAETVYINGAAGDGATAGVLHYVPKLPTHNGSALISNGSDSVANFPLEAEYLLILGSSVRCLQRLMANKTSSLPSDIPEPVLSEISISLPTFTVPDSFVLIPAPVGADISYSSVPSSPSYVQPILSLGSTPTISDLTISSTSPVAPSSPSFTSPDISGIFNPASSPPSYTAPVLTLGATPSISDLTISSIVPVVPVSPSFTTPDISSTTLNNLGVPPVYTAPTKTISGQTWSTEYPTQAGSITSSLALIVTAVAQAASAADKFTSATSDSQFDTNATWDATNSQLTRVKDALDKVSALVSANSPASSYDAHDLLQSEDLELLQGNLAIVQVELQRAQAHIAEWVAIGDMRVKEVNAALSQAQGQAQEIQTRLSATPLKVSEFQAKVQDSLNEFNQANVAYQTKLQEAIQQSQISSREAEQEANLKLQKEQQEYSAKLQKYQIEVSEYQANVSKEVQQYQQNLEGDLRVWQAERTTDLQKYGSDIQITLNTFNKENVEYQAQLQQAIQEVGLVLQKENQEYSSKLQKYNTEIQNYQADVSKEVQEYQQNLAGDIQIWQSERQTDLQKYSSDIQKETSRFQSNFNIYQQEIQKAIQTYQSETGYDMSKYGAEIQSQTSRFASDLQKNTETFRTSMERYVNDLRKVTEVNQSKLSKYGADIQNYGSKMQKHNADYQWKQGQYAQLKAEYNQGLQQLIGR